MRDWLLAIAVVTIVAVLKKQEQLLRLKKQSYLQYFTPEKQEQFIKEQFRVDLPMIV